MSLQLAKYVRDKGLKYTGSPAKYWTLGNYADTTVALGENSCKCFSWARTAANVSATRERIFTPNSQSEHQLLWAKTAANASEQLQMLQLQKEAEHCIIKRMDEQLGEQLQMLHVGQCNAMRARQPAVQYSASAWRSAVCFFSTKAQVCTE